jgi:lysophospholipase L1-like esterase
MKPRLVPILILALFCNFLPAHAQTAGKEHWVATWGTAQLLMRTPPPQAPAAQTSAAQPKPAAQPAPAQQAATGVQAINSRGFSNQTVRMMVRTSIGGRRIRVTLSNAFGSSPVAVGAAHIAIRAKDSAIVAGSDRVLSFSGRPNCILGPGVVIVSDAVDLNVPAFGDLAVSLFFPELTGPLTTHATGLHNTYVKEGDQTGQMEMTDALTTQSYYWLAGVDVVAPTKSALIVAFGDSITDGARSTSETNHSWPALLAGRLTAGKKTAQIAVVNMGIGGNRVLRDGTGASALARLDRDVLSQPGVKWLMILEGINDIGRQATVPAEAASAEDLIAAHKQIIERAHTHGIQVIGCTLTPYEGATYFQEEGEAIRQALNAWIRTGGAYDAVVDFETATRDPANLRRLRSEFDPGDHLHPNDAGYQAMANAVDLSIFIGKQKTTAQKKR